MINRIKSRLDRIELLRHRSAPALPSFDEIPQRDTPPTREELEALRRELSIPDAVFRDLFGDQL
jgi:hypothetical protein